MADQKTTQLDAVTTLADTDLVPVVVDPAGTPISKKITVGNMAAELAASSVPTSFPGIIQVQAIQSGAIATIGDAAAGGNGTGGNGSDANGPFRTMTSTTSLNADASINPSGGGVGYVQSR